ncbi:hypothetical protein COCSUDRAFT_41804 [Coccomyxa subellipsoidea C-169]|uniref:BZIP domain-containing protein n=1 Tax=Coccomyxa subellipsoidea (strain C-169) TaxID=574566 RepID=I0YYZ9_COCSC|nr:hypothetical protein COCSUDRAFT_41804 [Coccomyxa subellipsoidea C-169]EIE23618.1 hypothetical protein COCSUDRAFT_41804 [Coccomyxa subellipsoidea C-169]|eukprot:XP_005648162.1 hypothetical protein COCSUDRAFT_41804 [Coccomyxa subellipsoidea C-169]
MSTRLGLLYNRRAQKKYREKKMNEMDHYKVQIKELNAKMRQMAEEKRALKADRDRLEQIMQSGGAQVSSIPIQPSPAQQFVETLKCLFANGAEDVSSPAHNEALALMSKSREVQQILVLMFPFKAARLKADIQQQACREAGPHSPALWRSTVAAANFTPLQRQRLIALRAKFLKDIDDVVTERRILTQGIKAMLPHPGNASAFANTLFKAQLSTSQLRANLEREYQLVTHFICKAVHETITPIQHARCIVAAAPHLPDILYICSQLYIEEADLAADIDALPDMNTIFSDMSSYWWVTGQEQEEMDGSLWPAVYQGLDVYHEPSGPLSAPPAASLLGFTSFSQGADDVAAGAAEDELPTDAIAALLAADSLPLPDELDPCHTVEPAAALRWES